MRHRAALTAIHVGRSLRPRSSSTPSERSATQVVLSQANEVVRAIVSRPPQFGWGRRCARVAWLRIVALRNDCGTSSLRRCERVPRCGWCSSCTARAAQRPSRRSYRDAPRCLNPDLCPRPLSPATPISSRNGIRRATTPCVRTKSPRAHRANTGGSARGDRTTNGERAPTTAAKARDVLSAPGVAHPLRIDWTSFPPLSRPNGTLPSTVRSCPLASSSARRASFGGAALTRTTGPRACAIGRDSRRNARIARTAVGQRPTTWRV